MTIEQVDTTGVELLPPIDHPVERYGTSLDDPVVPDGTMDGLRLNLGCGPIPSPDHCIDGIHWNGIDGRARPPMDGWLRVDMYEDCEPDVMVDLQQFPWPWDDNSVAEVYSAHYVEHQTPANWIKFVDELWRVMKVGAIATIIHPNLKSVRAFANPTHLDFIPAERWLFANRQWRVDNESNRPPHPICNFGITNIVYGNFEPGLEHRSQEAQEAAIRGRWEAAQDIMVILTKKE